MSDERKFKSFEELSSRFPAKKNGQGKEDGQGAVKKGPSGTSRAKQAPKAPETDAENGLFLRAMSRVTPLGERPQGGRERVHDADREGFALLAGLILPGEGETSPKKRDRHGSCPPRAHKDDSVVAKTATPPHPSPDLTPAAGSRVLDEEARFARAMLASSSESEAEQSKELSLFDKAMRDVRPLSARGRDLSPAGREKPKSAAATDPAQALHDLINGKLEFAVQMSDEYLEGFVTDTDPLVLGKLRGGQYSPEAHLDLHGRNAEQAFTALIWFIKSAYQKNLRTVLVVTGRGKNSPEGIGVIRNQLQAWLTKDPFKRVVMAFCTAQPSDGGPGAVYVLLRKHKKGQGKIIWEKYLYNME